MAPDPSRLDGAEIRFYQGYRYTVVTIVNGAQPHTEEAELWWQCLNETDAKWRYFRRHVRSEIRFYQGYRYTVVTIVNGAQPHTEEAELWWQCLNETDAKWRYFRRHV